jgi:hypothetical protein
VRAFRAPTLTQLHDKLCFTIVEAPETQLDVITTVDVQMHNVIAEAQSMEWEFDLKNMWLTPSRWSMMVKQYLDPEELNAWLEQCAGKIGTKGRGIAVLRTRTVKPRGGPAQGNKETRRWGSCMLAISYKAKPRPQITLYSRTSYLGYLGALDLSVAWMCANYLAKAMGIGVEDISFVWMNEAMQYHNFKSLAYLLNHPDEDLRNDYRTMLIENKMSKQLASRMREAPALRLSRKWLQKLLAEDAAGLTLGDMTYNTYRRIRRRFHTEVMGMEYAKQFEGWSYYKVGPKTGEQKEFFKAYGVLPHTSIHNLDFRAIGMPLTGITSVDYDGDDDEADEEDED